MEKNYKVVKHGSFIDFRGLEHKFVVAGVMLDLYQYAHSGSCVNTPRFEGYVPFDKALSIGISICNPGNGNPDTGDTYNEKVGELQAIGRAEKKCDRVITFSKSGMVNTDIVNDFVNRTVNTLTNNPGIFIAGYAAAERKFKNEKTNK